MSADELKTTPMTDAVSVSLFESIRNAMELINSQGRPTTLIVVDQNNKVLGTVTDGDIRRGLLKGFTLNEPVNQIMNKVPIVAPSSMAQESMIELMKVNKIFHLPVVDENGILVRVEEGRIASKTIEQKLMAVIMAGAEGRRLRPLTETMPKPMLKVCNRPILEILIERLKLSGVEKIILNISYLGDVIKEYFGNGSNFDIDIEYVTDELKLGTAGPLGLLKGDLKPKESFLVLNGDIITDLNFRVFRDFHLNGGYDFTLCAHPHKIELPFGYPIIEGDVITNFQEKPMFTYQVNSGIYCLTPEILNYVPENRAFNMMELINQCLKESKRIGLFPLGEKFHEIGQMQSYQMADKFYEEVFGTNNEKSDR